MKQSKSSLNPDATPFVPSYFTAAAISFCGSNELDKVASPGFVEVGTDTDAHPLVGSLDSGSGNLDSNAIEEKAYDVPSVASDKNISSKGVMETGKADLEEEFLKVVEFLTAEFPNVSLESLYELFLISNGDLHETVNMLDQLEDPVPDADSPTTDVK